MARKLRVEYAGAIYHVMSRGDRREPIFRDAADREQFLETLTEACGKTGWEVHAYCLMDNHFHLVMETPQPNLVAGMKWLLGTYTGRFNRRHKLFGHVFSGRYKALIVDGSGTGYLRTVCEYVHLNPTRAKLVAEKEALRAYRWSSYPAYVGAPKKRPNWLRVDRVLGEMGVPRDSVAGRREFERVMERRRWEADGQEYQGIRRGWCLGDEAFRQELVEQMDVRAGPNHFGREVAEVAEVRAERIVAEGLRALDWEEADLARRPKGDVGKVRLAARLRAETTMTLAWIAGRLSMGTPAHLNNRLYWFRRGKLK